MHWSRLQEVLNWKQRAWKTISNSSVLHKCWRMRMDCGSLISSSGCTHKLEHTYRDTHTTMDGEQKGDTRSVPRLFLLFPPFFLCISVNFTLNQTFHNSTSIFFLFFLSKHHFFFVILSYFCYKTCTGCLEQQQKYNIQFICNFICLIIINSLSESSWSFSSFWLFQVHGPKWPRVHLGVGGLEGWGVGRVQINT